MIHQAKQSADDCVESLPEDLAHTAVDDEVEGTGETHEGVDDENNVARNVIIQQSQHYATAGESVQQCDHHQWDLTIRFSITPEVKKKKRRKKKEKKRLNWKIC